MLLELTTLLTESVSKFSKYWRTYRTYLLKITEGRMRGKPTRGRRRIQMLHDLATDEWWLRCTQTGSWGQRGMEIQRKDVCHTPALQQKTGSYTTCQVVFHDIPELYCASGYVVECRICNGEVAGSNLSRGLLCTKVYSAVHPPGVRKMSTSYSWEGKGRYGSFRLQRNVWVCR